MNRTVPSAPRAARTGLYLLALLLCLLLSACGDSAPTDGGKGGDRNGTTGTGATQPFRWARKPRPESR